MDPLVNVAYDRISEDVILLYDAVQAHKETYPRPAWFFVFQSMYQVLMAEDKALGEWKSPTRNKHTGREISPAWRKSGQGWKRVMGEDEFSAWEEEEAESGFWEFTRDLVTSVLSDLVVVPFWTVKISAVAHRGRLPELWPFVGYRASLTAIHRAEGFRGLFKGGMPICVGGLLRYFRRNRLLYTDYYYKTTHRLTSRLVMKGDTYNRHVNDREVLAQTYEGFVSRIVWAVMLHPFDLIATRMITESSPQYSTARLAVEHVLQSRGFAGLFLGCRASALNAIMPFGNWYLLGVPFLIKTRRGLCGMDTVFRAGMGGSLDMVRSILRNEGFQGLLAGYRATLWGVLPAFGSLVAARLVVYLLLGTSRRTSNQRRRRKALLRSLMASCNQELHARRSGGGGSSGAAGGGHGSGSGDGGGSSGGRGGGSSGSCSGGSGGSSSGGGGGGGSGSSGGSGSGSSGGSSSGSGGGGGSSSGGSDTGGGGGGGSILKRGTGSPGRSGRAPRSEAISRQRQEASERAAAVAAAEGVRVAREARAGEAATCGGDVEERPVGPVILK